jgi:hypothetical protein
MNIGLTTKMRPLIPATLNVDMQNSKRFKLTKSAFHSNY